MWRVTGDRLINSVYLIRISKLIEMDRKDAKGKIAQ